MGTRDAGDAMMPDDADLFDEQRTTNDQLKGTKALLAQSFPTLGQRLAREARRIASRRIPVFSWLRPLETTMKHLASLPELAQERFQRVEVTGSRLPMSYVDKPASPGATPISGHGAGTQPFSVGDQPLPPHLSYVDKLASPGPLSVSGHGAGTQPFSVGGQPLPPHLQQRLQHFVGQSTESIRIHNDAASHAFARAQLADAVTIGQHIFFREGQFRPQEERGFALLTHEALHVVRAMQPGRAWRRATQSGIQEEEQEAAGIESRALEARRNASWEPAPLSQAHFPARASLTSEPSASLSASAPALHPMKASTDRSLVNGEPAATPDMEALKRALYRDLMRQIKADLERGG